MPLLLISSICVYVVEVYTYIYRCSIRVEIFRNALEKKTQNYRNDITFH